MFTYSKQLGSNDYFNILTPHPISIRHSAKRCAKYAPHNCKLVSVDVSFEYNITHNTMQSEKNHAAKKSNSIDSVQMNIINKVSRHGYLNAKQKKLHRIGCKSASSYRSDKTTTRSRSDLAH